MCTHMFHCRTLTELKRERMSGGLWYAHQHFNKAKVVIDAGLKSGNILTSKTVEIKIY